MKDDVFVTSTLLVVSAIPAQQDPIFYLGAIMAICLGMVLRIGLDVKNKVFSKNSFIVQCLITFPVCFIAYFLWLEYELSFKIQNYLFFVSFFAVFIASIVDGMGKIGIKQYARYLLGKVLADSKEKEDSGA